MKRLTHSEKSYRNRKTGRKKYRNRRKDEGAEIESDRNKNREQLIKREEERSIEAGETDGGGQTDKKRGELAPWRGWSATEEQQCSTCKV